MESKKTTCDLVGDGFRPVTPAQHDNKMFDLQLGFGLPRFKLPCAECEVELNHTDIRSIGVALNARHFGDIVIELYCPQCHAGFQYHLRRQCKTVDDFIQVLKDGSDADPILAQAIQADESNLSAIIVEEMQ